MKQLCIAVIGLVLCVLPGLPKAEAQTAPPAPAPRDGSHDFDFNVGTWHAHIKRLSAPLTGSSTWNEMDGTAVVSKFWDGRGQTEVLEADDPAKGHFEGVHVLLYNPQAHQWNISFASSKDGTLGLPQAGEFRDGRGEFVDQETYKGRAILVRIAWSDIAADSHHFEQSFSDDGGRTWETNFEAKLTRIKS